MLKVFVADYLEDVVRLAEAQDACEDGVLRFRDAAANGYTVQKWASANDLDAGWLVRHVCLDAVLTFRDALYPQLGVFAMF